MFASFFQRSLCIRYLAAAFGGGEGGAAFLFVILNNIIMKQYISRWCIRVFFYDLYHFFIFLTFVYEIVHFPGLQ